MGLFSKSPPPTTAALSDVLDSRGFEVSDFDLEEENAPVLADAFGVFGGLMRVRCFSTGEERIYSTGSGSAWLGAFLSDLSRGHFARAARRRRGPTLSYAAA